jgi:cytochrome c oxidase subunit IV
VAFALYVLVLNEPPQSHETMYWVYRVSMIVMSLGKAFFIVAEFMHMWYEVRSFVFYTLITTTLLFWFILALLWEGSFFLDNRNDKNQFTTEIIKDS